MTDSAAIARAAIEQQQLAGLRRLLAELIPANRFHSAKLAAAGVSAAVSSLDEFASRVPFTTKAELVADHAANPPYGTNLTFPLDRYTRCHQTSGTSGSPMRWLDTAESWAALTDDWVEVLGAAGIRRGDRVVFAFSFGPFLGFWLAFEAAQRLGCLCFAGGGMSSALRARVLWENAATVLCCTPTYALHLAAVARAERLNPADCRVRALVVAGEPGGSVPATRARIAAAWNGARVFDHHGMTETGPVTYEHPTQPGSLVVMEHAFIAEVIDPATGQPVPDGETGELVLTTLRRSASPVLRYRTGDLVRARRTGFRLLLDGGILGRLDDMVIVRGLNIYPTAIEQIVRDVQGTGEFRVTLDRRAALPELSVEVEAGESQARELEHRLRTSLGLRIPVTAVASGILPAFELKARRWRKLG